MASYLDYGLSGLLFMNLKQLHSSSSFSHLNSYQDASILLDENINESLSISSC